MAAQTDEPRFLTKTFSLTSEHLRQLQALADQQERSVSWVLRQAIDLYVAQHGNAAR
jgi:predicted transcriptional regulator